MGKSKNEGGTEFDKTAVAEGDTLNLRLEQAKSASPVLVVISGKPLGKSFFLTKNKMILGRDLAADISLGESAVSRQHTEFTLCDDGICVTDLGSTNGTQVNDIKLAPNIVQVLNDGDLIRCGTTILKFLKEGKIENIHYGKMYDLATQDDLTQTLNKKAILDTLREEFARCFAKQLPLTLLMFDIDFFKKINDRYGHLAGDFILRESCSIIRNKLTRSQDILGRYGGEEFLLLLRDTSLQTAIEVAERIRSTLEKHAFIYDEQTIALTISIGLSTLDSSSKSAELLLQTADKALYDAKNQGRNRICVR